MFNQNLIKLKKKYHQDCLFNSDIFNLDLIINMNGELEGSFFCDERFQGYAGRVHGGVISGIMDSAMTQCLFGHNILAYTVRLNIKYSKPVLINKKSIIKVKLLEKPKTIFCKLAGEIFQDDEKLVSASSKFWQFKDV